MPDDKYSLSYASPQPKEPFDLKDAALNCFYLISLPVAAPAFVLMGLLMLLALLGSVYGISRSLFQA